MPSTARVRAFVAAVEAGSVLDAFETFYADDVVMQENQHPPTVGKSANRERERQFLASVRDVHENRAQLVLVDGDHAVINWRFAFTGRDGTRLCFDQLALQTWRGGGDDARITHERFVYDSVALAAPAGAL